MPKGVYPRKWRTLEELFLRHVKMPKTADGCWVWIGATNGRYGNMCYCPPPSNGFYPIRKMLYAHRVSYRLYRGEIPNGLEVLHNCPDGDNPLCVNPAHLKLGTHRDNIRDCVRKGRRRDGPHHVSHRVVLPTIKRISHVWLLCETCEIAFSVGKSRHDIARFCSRGCSGKAKKSIPIADRFWSKVDKVSNPNGCWIWTAYLNENGYGQIQRGREQGVIFAHRLSWILHNGEIPDGLEILHNCPSGDNSACVNPLHLRLGTHAENMKDAGDKARLPRGETHHASTITQEIVISILRLFSHGLKQIAIAKMLNMKLSHVHKIVRRERWKHITIPTEVDI